MKLKENSNESKASLLCIMLLAIFVVPTSISGTALALPAIGVDLKSSIDNLQWVVNAFNLTFACFTLPWGAMADRVGHKRCFLIGAIIYAFASIGSAMSNTPLFLDLMRGLAGIGAAAIFSCGISILSIQFEGAARMRAFALFGTVAGLGVSLGPTLSGILLSAFSWHVIFWFHAISLMIVIFASPLIPKDRIKVQHKNHFDFVGAILFTLILFLFMLIIVQGPVWGFENSIILALLISCIILICIFIKYEISHKQPMLDLTLLLHGRFVGMALVTVAASFGFVTLLTYLPIYFLVVLDFSPKQAGLSMILLTFPMLIFPILAGKLAAKGINSVHIIYVSLLCFLFGVSFLALISKPEISILLLAFPLILIGIGMGLSAGLVDGIALKVVPQERTGMAAGVINTFRLGSEAIAVALYGAFISIVLKQNLENHLTTFVSDEKISNRWIDQLASGDIKTALLEVTENQVPILKSVMEVNYNISFQATLWVLSLIILVLTIIIYKMINSNKIQS